MQSLIICFLLITNFFFFSKSVDAQEFQFTIPHNSIQFKQHGNYGNKTKLENNDGLNNTSINHSTDVVYLTNHNHQYLIREVLDSSLIVEINDSYTIDLLKDFPPALTFDYMVESEENLLVLDEPIFYITLEGENDQELIFAKTSKQSNYAWQKVVLDLRSYDLTNKRLIFFAGNLGNQEQLSTVYLKNLSTQIIIWHDNDQFFLNDRPINIQNDLVKQGRIILANQDWPIYQFTKQKINNLTVHQEADDSLTLLFSPLAESIFKNHQWYLSCEDDLSHELIQKRYYLLPQLLIKDFWPNLGDQIVINTSDILCEDVKQLSLEVF